MSLVAKNKGGEEDQLEPKETTSAEELQKSCREVTVGLNEQRKANSHPRLFLLLHRIKTHSPQPLTVGKFSLSSPPVMTGDLQSLFLYSIVGSQSSFKPRWCEIRPWRSISQVVIITVNLSRDNFLRNIDCFPYVTGNFQREANLLPCRFVEELLDVPLNPVERLKSDLKANAQVDTKCGCPSDSGCGCNDKSFSVPTKRLNSASDSSSTVGKCDLLLSMLDMIYDQYELPVNHQLVETDFVYSKDFYAKVTENSPIFSVDCEMCLTDFSTHELARISVVDEEMNVVLDTFVKPKNRITDYLTRYSGVTKKLLEGVTTSLADVQLALRRLLPPDAILCGHSLNFDLKAMRMYHPYVIDLSNLYNLSGDKKHKCSLQTLAFTFLGETIQDSRHGHCSVEDSVATMKLLKLKLKHGMKFGNVLLGWQHPGGTISQTSKEETDTPLEKHQLNERIPISVMPYIQSSKKRKRAQMQVENGVGHILKQMKMDIEIANGRHSPIAEKILLTCGSCQATFTPLCKSRTCQCLSLTRKTCHSCVVQLYEPLVSESSVDESLEVSTSGSISDSIADDDCRVSISEAFQIRHAPTESLFHFMPKRGKKAQWIGGSCHSHLHSQCANAKDVRSHYHFDENQERVQKFRESLLENNLGLLNLSVDKKDVEQMKLVDRLVQEVMISTAVKALVSVVFVSEKFKPNAGGVCFLTIKQD